MQSLSKSNKIICFLLCVIDVFSTYAWVVPFKNKKRITITNTFKKTLVESGRKLNKI